MKPLKKNSNAPVTSPKEIKIYKFSDKEFKLKEIQI